MCGTRTCAAVAHVRSFNSKLVRIRSVRGAMNCATTSQEDKSFNTYKVLLSGSAFNVQSVKFIFVSIPFKRDRLSELLLPVFLTPLLSVSIPFKRERLSEHTVMGQRVSIPITFSFNSLQTGKAFRTWHI